MMATVLQGSMNSAWGRMWNVTVKESGTSTLLRIVEVVLKEGRIREARLGIRGGLEGEGHVVGGGGLAVVPDDVIPEMEGELVSALGEVPGAGEVRHGLQILVVLDQGS